ncbi:hypothetical protein KJ885_04820 [Patescibacteria group bacterium]|nr:hypothetical protein [Patescibacteria group bacterium]
MVAKRPTDGTCLTKCTRSQKQVEKFGERLNYMRELLEPHIHKFAEERAKQVCRQVLQDPVEMAKESRKRAKEFLENPKRQEDEMAQAMILLAMADADGIDVSDYTPEKLREGVTRTAQETISLGDEELLEREQKLNQEVEESTVSDIRWMVADILAKTVFHTCLDFFEGGGQSLSVQDLVDKIEFAKGNLGRELPEEYWPEMRKILRELMPELLRKSLVDVAGRRDKQTYFEIFYSDTLDKIVMHPISWEAVQVWAHS